MVEKLSSTGSYPAAELISIARRVPEEVATEGHFDLVDELFAEDHVEHGPMGTIEGRDRMRAQLEGFIAAFEDFSATVEDAVAGDDIVTMRLTLRGTHVGEFMGIEPTGASFEITNLVWTRLEDDRIVERWVVPDMLSFLRQVGVEEFSVPVMA